MAIGVAAMILNFFGLVSMLQLIYLTPNTDALLSEEKGRRIHTSSKTRKENNDHQKTESDIVKHGIGIYKVMSQKKNNDDVNR